MLSNMRIKVQRIFLEEVLKLSELSMLVTRSGLQVQFPLEIALLKTHPLKYFIHFLNVFYEKAHPKKEGPLLIIETAYV